MIKSGAKVTVEETDVGTVISILPESSLWQRTITAVWAVVWTLTGMLALVGMLKASAQNSGTFMLVFFTFWLYFLFYALRSLIWQLSGCEFIRLTTDSLDYKRSWNEYGRVKSYDLTTIKSLGMVNYEDKKFAKSYHDAFWTIGGEMIGFTYLGKKVAIGFKLNKKQATDILGRINAAIKAAERLN